MPAPVLLTNFAKFYTSNFDRKPVATLTITNSLLNTLADFAAQGSQILLSRRSLPSPDTPEFEPPPPSYDPLRTLRFAVFGAAMGPIIGAWMRLLERAVPMGKAAIAASNANRGLLGYRGGKKRPSDTVQLVKRVLADQLVMAPIGLVLFVSSMGFMEGKDMHGIGEKFQDMYIPAILSNWKVWPLAQAVNFKLMPLQYRVPFQSTCGIAWNIYLSLLNARDDKHIEAIHASK